MMVKTLQCNTNRCRAAHHLLDNTLELGGYEIAIISEPNRAAVLGPGWVVDQKEDAAIWTSREAQGKIVTKGRGDGYVWVDIGATVIYSCYISPNCEAAEFDSFLDDLEGSLETWSAGRLLVVAGDFNASAEEWGSVAQTRGAGSCWRWRAEEAFF